MYHKQLETPVKELFAMSENIPCVLTEYFPMHKPSIL